MRERNLAELRVRGDAVELVDTTGNPAQARESVNLIRAQVPDGYRVALAGDPRSRAQTDTRNARNGAAQADAPNARNGATQAEARNARSSATQAAADTASSNESRKTRAQLRAEAKKAAAGKRAETKKTAAEKRADARRAAVSGKTADGSTASIRNAGSKDAASAKRLAAREDAAGRSSSKTAAAGNCKSVSALSAPVYFSSNTATLTAAERRRLRNLGACLGKTAWVRVTGHADPRDSAAATRASPSAVPVPWPAPLLPAGFPPHASPWWGLARSNPKQRRARPPSSVPGGWISGWGEEGCRLRITAAETPPPASGQPESGPSSG